MKEAEEKKRERDRDSEVVAVSVVGERRRSADFLPPRVT